MNVFRCHVGLGLRRISIRLLVIRHLLNLVFDVIVVEVIIARVKLLIEFQFILNI